MSTHTKVLCDICGNEAKYPKTPIVVIQITEETEGRYTKPHLKNVTLDLCEICVDKLLERYPLTSAGAQGYNKYEWRKP